MARVGKRIKQKPHSPSFSERRRNIKLPYTPIHLSEEDLEKAVRAAIKPT